MAAEFTARRMPQRLGTIDRGGPRNLAPAPALHPSSAGLPTAGLSAAEAFSDIGPQAPPFAWGEVQGSKEFDAAEAVDQFRVKRAYYQQYVAPTGKDWDTFEYETGPNIGERVMGGVYGMIGGLEQTAALGAKAMGRPDLEAGLQARAKANEKYAARTAYMAKYGEHGWEQIKNLSDPEWWKATLATMGPSSAPFMAGALTGAGAGALAGSVVPVVGTALGALIGGIIGGGGAAALQELGPAYYEYLDKHPGDDGGATEYAWVRAGLSGILNAASIPLAGAGMALGPVKHTLVQMVVQGNVGMADQLAQNWARRDFLDPTQPLSEAMAANFIGEAVFEAPGLTAAMRSMRKIRIENALNAEQVLGAETDPSGMPNRPNPEPVDRSSVVEEPAPAPQTGAAEPPGAQVPPAGAPPGAGGAATAPPGAGVPPQAETGIPASEPTPAQEAPNAGETQVRGEETPLAGSGAVVDEGPPPGAPPEAPSAPTPLTPVDEKAHGAATSPLNDKPEPTPPQTEAGNYPKGHLSLHGLDISVENPQGSTRRGTRPDGSAWETVLPHHYGYIRGTEGRDGDQVDVFIGPNPDSQIAYVVDQIDPETGKFDEHKVLLGFSDQAEAEQGYRDAYDEGWQGLGAMSELSVPELKTWLGKEGRRRAPYTRGLESKIQGERAPVVEPVEPAGPVTAGPAEDQAPPASERPSARAEAGEQPSEQEAPAAERETEYTPKFKVGDRVRLPSQKPSERVVIGSISKDQEGKWQYWVSSAALGQFSMDAKSADPTLIVSEAPIEMVQDADGNWYVRGDTKPWKERIKRAVRRGRDSGWRGESKGWKVSAGSEAQVRQALADLLVGEEEARTGTTKETPDETTPTPAATGAEARTTPSTVLEDRNIPEQHAGWIADVYWHPVENGAVTTSSGRKIAAPPDIRTGDTRQKVKNDVQALMEWVRSEAIDEANAVGNTLAQGTFHAINTRNFTSSDGESAVQFLFGEASTEVRPRQAETPTPQPAIIEAEAEETPDERAAELPEPAEPLGPEAPGLPAGAQSQTAKGPAEAGPAAGARAGGAAEGGGLRPADEGRAADEGGAAGSGDAGGEQRGDQGGGAAAPARTGAGRPGANYRIAPDENIAPRTPVTKYDANVAAIRLLKQIEAEGRLATPAEQAELVRYTGWGSLPQVFNPYQSDNSKSWFDRQKELRELLDDEEFAAARKSTLNAHFTARNVIEFMYSGLDRMGFKGGRALEPSMGVGHFMGLMPTSMAAASKWVGIELDSITGRIAKQLYQKTDVRVQGYEKARLPHNFFDAAISNVPFGDYNVRYNKRGHRIHNFFFLKALDEVRPGGLISFITSSGTLDSRGNDHIRRMLWKQADLVTAIRLPGDAFKDNAGTEVTADIIVLQKRPEGAALPTAEPAWLTTDMRALPNGHENAVNRYFLENPAHVLGEMVPDKLYQTRWGVRLRDGATLDATLERAAELFPQDVYREQRKAESKVIEAGGAAIVFSDGGAGSELAGAHLKEGQYTLEKGKLQQRQGGLLVDATLNKADEARVRGMVGLRNLVRELLDAQVQNLPDDAISGRQKALSRSYDTFVKKHGPVSAPKNHRAFNADPDLYLVESIEHYDPETETATKAAIFTKRTIEQHKPVERAESAGDALVVSLNERGRVDLEHMARITGMSEPQLTSELRGRIYLDPTTEQWETDDSYLSGNVRAKLAQAQAAAKIDPRYEANAKALEAVQPTDLLPSEIQVRLGAPWVPTEDISAFGKAVLGVQLTIRHHEATSLWKVERGGAWGIMNASNTEEYGTPNHRGDNLLELALNFKRPQVWYKDADGNRRLDVEATTASQAQLVKLKDKFAEWIWEDEGRAERLAGDYNEGYNNLRLREFDGSHLTLPGMNPAIKLHQHQKNAIWRMIQQPNTLLAHAVGAGKTWAMTAAGMEMKRMGLVKKPMYVVPNHMLEQFSREFLQLYPNARILAATRDDLSSKNRKKMLSRISTGDWDAVIIAHSSFGMIPVSPEFQEGLVRDQINEIVAAIQEEMANSGRGGNRLVKQLEKQRERLEDRLKKLQDASRKDDLLNFDQLGVDQLFVDEAHAYKRLYFVSKMSNVKNLPSGAESGRAFDMFVKSRLLQERNGGRGVVMATATPITNTMAEMFTMQRYMMWDELQSAGLTHFDNWAGIFGDIVTSWERGPEGGDYKAVERFARFTNLPDLLQQFRSFTDVLTDEELSHLVKRPSLRGEGYEVVETDASEALLAFQEHLVERMKNLKGPPTKGGDNALVITTDGRKAALDMRLVAPRMADDPNSKVNQAVSKVYEIWKRTEAKRSTQMVFIDFSTPHKGQFSVYQDIADKLVGKGVPAEEIAFIQDHETDAAKDKLFRSVRAGRVRVLLGSTQKMGQGTNVQNKLFALHHLDAPWVPAYIEQRDGRMVRQGNENPEVEIYQYVTKRSFDEFMWTQLTAKAKFIAQAMRGDATQRMAEDVDDAVLNAQEIAAIASGNPLVREKADVDAKVSKLAMLQRAHNDSISRRRRELVRLPEQIESVTSRLEKVRADVARREDTSGDAFKIELEGMVYTDRKEAGQVLLALAKKYDGTMSPKEVGRLAGFKYSILPTENTGYLEGERTYYRLVQMRPSWSQGGLVEPDGVGAIVASEHLATRSMEGQRAGLEAELKEASTRYQDIKKLTDAPFAQQAELDAALERQNAIYAELGLGQDQVVGEEEGAEENAAGQTSDAPQSRATLASTRPTLDVAALKARLEAQVGPKVTLQLFDKSAPNTEENIAGWTDAARGVVALSYWAHDPKGVIDHEAWHYVLDTLSEPQRELVQRKYAKGTQASRAVERQMARQGYKAALADAAYLDWEERSGYAYQFHRRGEGKQKAGLGHIFNRITNFLERVYNAVRGLGFETVQDLMEATSRGEMAGGTPQGYNEGALPQARQPTVAPGREMPTAPRKLTDKLFNIPFRLIPAHKAYGWVMDRLIDRVPTRVKAGLFDRYGETDEMKGGRLRYRQARMHAVVNIRKSVEGLVGLDRAESRVAYNWLTTNDAALEAQLLAELPEESKEQVKAIKARIETLGQEAVRLGLVTEDSFQRNRFAYLRRSYLKHELNEDGTLPAERKRAIKILGDNLKGRGIADDYSRARLSENAGAEWWERNHRNLKGQKFMRMEKRAKTGRLRTYAYVPVGEALPDQFAGWTPDADENGALNLWEARWDGRTAATIGMWRDLSKTERDSLGEIDEVKYAVARTLMGMLHDIETARYFEWIGAHPEWAVTDPAQIPEGHTAARGASRSGAYLPTEWVQVPDSRIAHTPSIKIYGALAGQWVPGPIWNEIRNVADWNRLDRWKWYSDLIRAFKVSKTALSPTTQINNAMANLLFAEWADVRASSVVGSLQTYIQAWSGDAKAREALDDFTHSGAGYGTFAEQELRDEVLEPLRKALAEEAERHGVEHADGHALSGVRAFALVDSIIQGLSAGVGKAVDLYQFGDNVFRLAAFQQALAEGKTTEEAAAIATDAFLDYDINAPWVNVARQSALPFIAFSYRAIPKLHRLIKEKPYKLLKLTMIMGALNAASYAFLGSDGDEEEERRLLPPERQGKIFGLFPRMLRMPWNHHGEPLFLDIVRWVPAGDLFLWQDTKTAVPILPFLVPGGPLEWGMEFIANKDFYTGEPITTETDTPYEAGKKVALHLWKGIAPNAVVVPYSYSYDKVFPSFPAGVKAPLRAVGLGSDTPNMDPFGREYPSLIGALNAFGFKLAVFPGDVAKMRVMQRANAHIREIELTYKRAARSHMRGGIDRAELEAHAAVAREKIERIARGVRDTIEGPPGK